jgi:hypothetical protein
MPKNLISQRFNDVKKTKALLEASGNPKNGDYQRDRFVRPLIR